MNGDKNNADNLEENIDIPPTFDQSVINDIAKSLKLINYEFKITENFGKGDNYLGKIYRAVICGLNDNGKKQSNNLILKFAHTNVQLREHLPLHILYSREAFVYETFLPTIDEFQKDRNVPESEHFRFPKCYAVDMKRMSEVIVLEDLKDKHFRMFDRLKDLDYEHTVLIIKNIAKFHALSFAIKDRKPNIYEQAMRHKFYLTDFGEGFVDNITKSKIAATDNIDDPEHKARFSKFAQKASEELKDSLDIDDDDCPYKVICHGDCWNNNFLFRYEESKPIEVIMLDWQIVRYASPITDLSYFFYIGTDKAFRDKYLKEMYDIYYKTLKDHLGKLDVDVDKCYPEHVFRQQIKSKSKHGLIWSFLILPITLNSREEAVDLDDMIRVEQEEGFELQYTPQCKTRFNEVVADFVEMGII